MENPWKSIALSDYENHMKSDAVMQLQTLNCMMKEQLSAFPAHSAMILGVAGGNGLEHVRPEQYQTVYAVDINARYLQEVQKRYAVLDGTLKCLCLDLTTESAKLPACRLVIANLLIEYIGYDCFQQIIAQVKPAYICCGIQINTDKDFVSNSPYLHAFDGLNYIHHQIDINELRQILSKINYQCISTKEYPLPGGKKLMQMDFLSIRDVF
ncbi:MAG: methyltransferase type 11 [Lachnospiraceae bacterium]|nr:methyltransferase type 11 [Lachnospiraceae bacterium]MDE7030547.1 methyltransferase type 11 [Lachnospiraceae bacterium]